MPRGIIKNMSKITGTLKWFDAKKGYGFITPDDGGKDVFIHISAFEQAHITNIRDKMMLEYELVDNRGREIAGNVSQPDSFNR